MIASNNQQPAAIRCQAVTEDDIMPTHQHAISLTFEHCASDHWTNIGRVIALLPQLQTLVLLHCATTDTLYETLSKSKSLLRLRIGTCYLTQNIAALRRRGYNISRR